VGATSSGVSGDRLVGLGRRGVSAGHSVVTSALGGMSVPVDVVASAETSAVVARVSGGMIEVPMRVRVAALGSAGTTGPDGMTGLPGAAGSGARSGKRGSGRGAMIR
jgi:hypothetical protein